MQGLAKSILVKNSLAGKYRHPAHQAEFAVSCQTVAKGLGGMELHGMASRRAAGA